MLQELSLFGQVTADDQPIVQQQLAALTRMRPQPVLERHLTFKPTVQQQDQQILSLPNDSATVAGRGGSGASNKKQQELQRIRQMLNAPLHYVQVIGVPAAAAQKGEDTDQHGGREGAEMVSDSAGNSRQRGRMQWMLEFRDLPEAGKMAVTCRTVSRIRIMDGDPVRFMSGLGYEYQSQHTVTGTRFYDHETSTTFSLYRVMQANTNLATNQHPITETPTTNDLLHPLDQSGTYILHTSIEITHNPASTTATTTNTTTTTTANINSTSLLLPSSTSEGRQQNQQQPNNSQALKDRATKHLLATKETLKESVGLAPAERLALDTRVKGTGYNRR